MTEDAVSGETAIPMQPQELLKELVRALVDHPGQVRVEPLPRGHVSGGMLVHCAPTDRGIVIGKQGATISALRLLMGRVLRLPRAYEAEIEVAGSKERQ